MIRLRLPALALLLVVGACGAGTGSIPIEPVDLPPTGQPDTPPPPTLPPPDGQPPSDPPPTGDPFAGGVLATFRTTGTEPDGTPFDESFRIWVLNPKTIDDLFALQAGTSLATIPVGKLLAGPGQADHNAPWSWHIDPVQVEMGEVAIEVCDGRPSIVESMLASYLALGQFCPWNMNLESIEDHR